MIKNILFLILCIAIFWVSLVFFQTFGIYSFTIMLVLVVVYLVSRIGKPKFGGKNKAKNINTDAQD